MNPIYDQIGKGYASQRKNDPIIAEQIFSKLTNVTSILNIGAGSGSYEPENINLTAIEPSSEMIGQRSENAHPVIQGVAEELPFEDNYFSHAMTVLSMHHWKDRTKAFKEINRVTRDSFVAITWNPEAPPFWLTRDYFPEIYETDKTIFPFKSEFEEHFDNVNLTPLFIHEDCQDGFLAAYWKRPEAYLRLEVRNSISTFSKLKDSSVGLKKLQVDLDTGRWKEDNRALLNVSQLDVGYTIVTAKIRTA